MRQRFVVSLMLGLAACTAASAPPVEELLARAVALEKDSTLVRSVVGEDPESYGPMVEEFRARDGGPVLLTVLSSGGEEHSDNTKYFFENGEVFAIISDASQMPAMRLTRRWDTLVVREGKVIYQGHGSYVEDPQIVGDTAAQTLEALLERLRTSRGK